MKEQEIKVTVRQIREMAEALDDAEQVLKEMFPAAFEQDEYFFFGRSFATSIYWTEESPFMIGNGLARHSHKLRVLIVSPEWEPQIVKDYADGRKAILLKRMQE